MEATGEKLRQLCLYMDGSELPQLVSEPAGKGSHAANLVPLPGCVIESDGDIAREEYCWKMASKVADVCKEGFEAKRSNEYCEHLAYAYSILCDYVKEFDDDYTMSKETAETLIRGAIDRIVRAGKCFGLRLDQYRSDD
jgi:hypothetical protein